MRALAVHPDVIVVVSGVWQTTCTAVRYEDEGFLIDSPVLPDELDALPTLLEQASFPISGLLATHGDWDHLLGRLAFPDAGLGVGESTATRLAATLGEPQRKLRDFDDEFYVTGRAPLGLGGVQSLPTPGRISIGSSSDAELEVHRTSGHVADGVAFFVPWASALVCGDYLSPVEIPRWDGGIGTGKPEAYLGTLDRLAELVARATTVIPGHGEPMPRERAEAVLAEDRAYVAAVHAGHGLEVSLPDGRRGAEQKRIHAANLAAL
jgi:glyoxylase-like metal-dependent hydrolase (beta-lactamase superfamily II)